MENCKLVKWAIRKFTLSSAGDNDGFSIESILHYVSHENLGKHSICSNNFIVERQVHDICIWHEVCAFRHVNILFFIVFLCWQIWSSPLDACEHRSYHLRLDLSSKQSSVRLINSCAQKIHDYFILLIQWLYESNSPFPYVRFPWSTSAQHAEYPPSIGTECPLMNDDFPLKRKTIGSTTSRISAKRCNGILPFNSSPLAPLQWAMLILVQTTVGFTLFTRMFRFPYSRASARVKPSRPALVIEYTLWCANADKPANEETFTMLPPSFMFGTKICVTLKMPFRLTFIVLQNGEEEIENAERERSRHSTHLSKSCSVKSSNGLPMPTPALLTRPSIFMPFKNLPKTNRVSFQFLKSTVAVSTFGQTALSSSNGPDDLEIA